MSILRVFWGPGDVGSKLDDFRLDQTESKADY